MTLTRSVLSIVAYAAMVGGLAVAGVLAARMPGLRLTMMAGPSLPLDLRAQPDEAGPGRHRKDAEADDPPQDVFLAGEEGGLRDEVTLWQAVASSRTIRPGQARSSLRAWLWGERGLTGEILLTSKQVRVGRGAKSDVVLTDPTVSREHATLTYANGAWWLLPAITSNGTWLNGTVVQPGESRVLTDGALLQFGLHTEVRMFIPPALAQPELVFATAARSTPGTRPRDSDRLQIIEDAHLATAQLLVIADGVSDRPSPYFAARTAVDEVARSPAEAPLPEVVERVNGYILSIGSDALQHQGMATALDVVRLARDEVRGWWLEGAHVGDGQVLLQDNLGIHRMTGQGTVGGRLADVDPDRAAGLAADPDYHRLAAAVGLGTEVDAERWWAYADHEQRLVLTTDGLINALGSDGVCEVMRQHRAAAPDEVADTLIQLAIGARAAQNVTVIVSDIAIRDD